MFMNNGCLECHDLGMGLGHARLTSYTLEWTSCPTSKMRRKDLGHICGSLPHLVSILLGMKPPKGQIREAHRLKQTILTRE